MSCPRSVPRPGPFTRPRRPRVTGTLTRLLAAAVMLLALVPPVAAQDALPRLEEQLTDAVDVLTAGEERDVIDALDALREDANVQLFVLYTDTTGIEDAPEFAERTAEFNSMGANDALLLVAFEDRSYALWVAEGLAEVTDAEIDDILANALEPALVDGDNAGAAIATAGGAGRSRHERRRGHPHGAARQSHDAPRRRVGGSEDSGGIDVTAILAVLILGGGLLLLVRTLLVRRAAAKADDEERDRLSREANAALLSVDELLRDAEQELGFAEAQWGDAEAKPFREAMLRAATELKAAFAVRQQLDDHIPETTEQRRAMLAEIVERTGRARTELEARWTELDPSCGTSSATAPKLLAALPPVIEALRPRRDAAEATLTGLRAYAESVWGPVGGNLTEARKGLEGARTAVTVGSAAVAAAGPSDVAVATRTALEGMTGAGVLLDAVERLAAAVADAERRVPDELAAAERDLADATSALAGRPVDGAADTRRRAAVSALEAARRASLARPADPLEALRLATEAHRLADEALVVARDAATAADRIRAAADSSVRTASAEVDRAASFIASRRRGVGETARTRLAEAQRHLVEAAGLLQSDPTRALEAGRRSQALAQEAHRLAQDDFNDWDQGGPGWGQRRSTGGDQTAEVLGSILGGVLGGVLSGGSRGSGWGGSPWGGSGGGRSGGGGFGMPSGPRGGGWGGGRAARAAAVEAGAPAAGGGDARTGQTERNGRPARIDRAARSSIRQGGQHMAQTSILGRMGQLVRANINALLDQAEDPEKMLDQLIRDFTNNIAEAEEAVAQTVGNLRLLEDDEREARGASAEWLSKAKCGLRRADGAARGGQRGRGGPLRRAGQDRPAPPAQLRGAAGHLRAQIAQQTELTEKLKDGLNKLRVKREELVQKRDELVSRAKMAQAQMQVQQTLKDVSVLDPTSRAQPLRGAVRRQEAQAAAWRRSASPRSRTSSPSSRARGRPGGRGPARRAGQGAASGARSAQASGA
jgi:phage shock protein A/uncharacterized membrane protein YgcG